MLDRKSFRGLWAGLPVAWTEHGAFDEATYRGDVARCCEAGVPGVYTGGTTGEFYAMELDEFRAVARATVDECRTHGVPVMIGCTSTYTRGAALRCAFAASLGADAIQVALPFWMPVRDEDVVGFFREVASAAPDIAVSIYETARAKRTLTLDLHRAVKDAVDQYMMVKATANTIGSTPQGCEALSEMVNVFVGEHRLAELGPHGAAGGCSSLVYFNPRVLQKLWSCVENKDWPAAEGICGKLKKLHDFLCNRFEGRGLTDTGFDRLGGVSSGFLKTNLKGRAPYPSADEQDVEAVRQWCKESFPDMLVL